MKNLFPIFSNAKLSSFHQQTLRAAVAVVCTPLLACSSMQPAPPSVAAGASCQELAANDATLSHFYQPGTVYDARRVKERVFKARANQPIVTRGASLYVKAEPEMNAPYLRRVLSCHAAGKADMSPNDPLRPSSGAVTELAVRESRNGFAVDVLSDDPKVGEEIWKRAQSMSQKSTSEGTAQIGASFEANAHF